jgi:hypothetical protein
MRNNLMISFFLQVNVNVTSLTPNVTLADSELTKINPNTTTEKEIRAAFCREVARTARVYTPPPGIRRPDMSNMDVRLSDHASQGLILINFVLLFSRFFHHL